MTAIASGAAAPRAAGTPLPGAILFAAVCSANLERETRRVKLEAGCESSTRQAQVSRSISPCCTQLNRQSACNSTHALECSLTAGMRKSMHTNSFPSTNSGRAALTRPIEENGHWWAHSAFSEIAGRMFTLMPESPMSVAGYSNSHVQVHFRAVAKRNHTVSAP
jgi:hypothetical protein